MEVISFSQLLEENKGAIERFIMFRMPSKTDGEDVLQETFLAGFKQFASLENKSCFKAWMLSIARNKCNDFYRNRAKRMEIELDETIDIEFSRNRMGVSVTQVVQEAMDLLADKEKQILFLYYFKQMPQEDIAIKLQIPLGTVKSRIHTAKEKFKKNYPFTHKIKGGITMNKLPEMMPTYTIEKTDKEPFCVKWNELLGWFLVPTLGEKLTWAMYDYPEKKQSAKTEMQVLGKAAVHGIEGVEIVATEYNTNGFSAANKSNVVERRFAAQLTDTHCRILSESHIEDDVKHLYTFLDGDLFISNWGFGQDNCGKETEIKPKNLISISGNEISYKDNPQVLDVVGSYNVTINNKIYDTICIMDIELYIGGVMSETYIDTNGRTVLWRRFNRNDWAFSHYQQQWVDKLPKNQQVVINGITYVHWYDCITDYIL